MIDAVIFDMDGVLIDSEGTWADVRHRYVLAHGGRWAGDAQRRMMGMSAPEWAAYMHEDLGVPVDPADIVDAVAAEMAQHYRERVPLLPGAVDAVRRLGVRWPLGLASSANRVLIDLVLDEAGLTASFAVTLSTEEVPRGKPAPDVYLEAARRLGVSPAHCAGVEDSTNGIRALVVAGMRVVAVPNREFPPEPDVLASADVVIPDLTELTVETVAPGTQNRSQDRPR
ncbi:MAG: HAD family phosphatase [Acidimicrobiia bacterium]|nr:HAD family phosphatase [Acidimicrobiia bacterium]